MRAIVPLGLLGALVLGGCSGEDARERATQAREAAAEADAAVPADATAVPEALRNFRCETDDDGSWFAAGTVKNSTTMRLDYRVTVQVGPGGDDVAAAAVDLEGVEADATADFLLDELPATGSDGPCRAMVVALAPS